MRLDLLLVARGLCVTRQEAQEIIGKGDVLVNGVPLTKQSKDVKDDVVIDVLSTRKYVSRGGEKLAGAFGSLFEGDEAIYLFLKDKSALDVGASTGGFTDFLLQHGVSSVTAVDVGSSQLHERIKNDKRVSSFENTDIRNFPPGAKYEIIVADLSFIPLKNVLDTIISFGTAGSYFFLLIKPQFEVGKGNTKNGVVKNLTLVEDLLKTYEGLLKECGAKSISMVPCAIKGGDGNQEYFAIFSL